MRKVLRFARHYGEMVVAMMVGMLLLYPVWMVATTDVAATSALRSVEVESLVMATTMAVPMVAWMRRFRGHGWAPSLEMGAAMYAGFLVVFPFHWAGAADADAVMLVGHALMFTLMLVAMLARREEYAGHCDSAATAATRAAEAGVS